MVKHSNRVNIIVNFHTQDEMTNALATMRVNYDQIKIKDMTDATNPLLLKRRVKEQDVKS